MNPSRLTKRIEQDEGRKRKIYADTEGIPTIGVGRNLRSVGLTDDEIEYLYGNDLRRALLAARRACPSFVFLDDVRQEVLVNMAFNLGWASLAAFRKMLEAIERKDFAKAAEEMERSKWFTQVGKRAKRLVREMRTGVHDSERV